MKRWKHEKGYERCVFFLVVGMCFFSGSLNVVYAEDRNAYFCESFQSAENSYPFFFSDDEYFKETKKLFEIVPQMDEKYKNQDLFPEKTGRNPIVFDPAGFWIKPRGSSCCVWEFAGLLGMSTYFPPAIPFEHFGRICNVQKHCSGMSYGPWVLDSPGYVDKVSVEDYWKGLIAVFLLGIDDLHGSNIGITSEGRLYFFDLETAFVCGIPNAERRYIDNSNNKYKTLYTSFALVAFDWPQFCIPLTFDQAKSIQKYIQKISQKLKFLEKMESYNLLEQIFFMSMVFLDSKKENIQNILSGIKEKVKILQTKNVEEGICFKDIYFQLFPVLKGHEKEICAFGSKIYGRSGFGASIWLLQRLIHICWQDTNPEVLKELTNWVDALFNEKNKGESFRAFS